MELHWLARVDDWRAGLRALPADPALAWQHAVGLANARIDFVQTRMLDQSLRGVLTAPPPDLRTRPVRLAVLASAVTTHLQPAIRVAGLRRGIWVDTYECAFAQYWSDLTDPASGLHRFGPDAVLFAFDAHHVCEGLAATLSATDAESLLDRRKAHIRDMWRLARAAFRGPILQQAILPVHPPLLGGNEHRLPGSRAHFVVRLNGALREMAAVEGVDILAADTHAAQDGVRRWHDSALWHRAKQEISPVAAPLYGDLVGRWLAASQGRSFKCLVLDLDNTIWGGVIGDDGLEGIVVGQGTALGEAYLAVQHLARELSARGIILAVCSKNDLANAERPFLHHPDMVLRRDDIACFVANWSDKASNLRAIAGALNIGLDSLVFLDDNPFERNLVRKELPMVAVPEVSDDPAGYVRALTDGGYFESLVLTEEDRVRSRQYQENQARAALQSATTDLASYLRELGMVLSCKRFDRIGLQRIVQLINKSNQFNLTTRRYTEAEVLAVMDDPCAVGMQLRLLDRFGDNGMIGVIIGRLEDAVDLRIDTWVMSCRVLGRQVEAATLALIMRAAQRLGAARVIGDFFPTDRNAMVRNHYRDLGFTVSEHPTGGSQGVLSVAGFTPTPTFIELRED